jgi:hypothetical protein
MQAHFSSLVLVDYGNRWTFGVDNTKYIYDVNEMAESDKDGKSRKPRDKYEIILIINLSKALTQTHGKNVAIIHVLVVRL